MKQLVISLLMLIPVSVIAQNFEGTIAWSMKMEITDPAKKAKMEEARKKMNDPAEQERMKAQMKMHEDKMKTDPQYKAMMDNNPQIRAQMEQMAQLQAGGGDIMPSGLVLKLKDRNSLVKIEGGIMAGEFLHLADGDKTYMINRNSKTYSVLQGGGNSNSQPSKPDVKVIKTNETAMILNYNCVKYNIETTQGGKSITHAIWSTPELKDIDMKALSRQGMANTNVFFHEGIDGFPLKAEMNSQDGKLVIEAKEIKRESLPATLFTLPGDFKEGPMSMPLFRN